MPTRLRARSGRSGEGPASRDGGAPVDVLGFSYGGQLVQRLTVAAPERVRRAIIASSSILPVQLEAFAG